LWLNAVSGLIIGTGLGLAEKATENVVGSWVNKLKDDFVTVVGVIKWWIEFFKKKIRGRQD